ncbi:MAG: hypothetical protein ACRDKW_14780 [Actinomycetota bacterium]
MLLETYSGPATVVQPGGVEVRVHCEFRVERREQGEVQGLAHWRGSYSTLDAGSCLDRNLAALLVLPDGRRGSILITAVYSAFSSYEGTGREAFTGSGVPGDRA